MINCTYRYLLDFDADMYMSFYKRTYAKSDKIYNFDGYVGYKNSHMTQDTAAWYYTSYNNLTTMNLFWDMLDNTRYQYQQLVLTSYYNDTKYLFSYDSSTGAIELHTWSGENGIKYIGKTVIDKVSSPSLANVISNVPNNEVFYMEKSRSWCGFLLDVSSETKSITDINEGVTYYFTQDD